MHHNGAVGRPGLADQPVVPYRMHELPARPRRRVLTSTGRLLVIFAAGSVGTVAGTLVAARVMPLQTLGSDAWKVLAPTDLLSAPV